MKWSFYESSISASICLHLGTHIPDIFIRKGIENQQKGGRSIPVGIPY